MFKLLLSIISLSVLSSCSVVMAAKKEGTSIEKVQDCRTRSQFLSLGPKVISSEREPFGDFVEVYQFQKEKGSAARAWMHGLLDVGTCGLWEVVGTPIEVWGNEDGSFSLKVFYDCNENIKKMELL